MRATLQRLAFLLPLLVTGAKAGTALGNETDPIRSREQLVRMVLQDPDSPVAGNPQGDVTIVAFLDYNCPYCRRTTPELERFLASDSKVRVVYKDWPIFGAGSIAAARLALAASYQGKYSAAHAALMRMSVRSASQDALKDGLEAAGIDKKTLTADLERHTDAISHELQRNAEEAEALGFQGTPVFIGGPFVMRNELDEAGFRQAVSDARARSSGK